MLAHQAVAALDPNTGEDRAFEIITALGTLMWTVDRAALVFCIDQVEDLRFFDDAEERFQKAVRDLIQIANRLPTSIIIISCLEDFYGQVRGVLAQSYIDRIEKAGPVALLESRTPEEARLIIAKRLEHLAESARTAPASRSAAYLRPAVLRGVRRPVDAPPARARADAPARQDGAAKPEEAEEPDADAGSFVVRARRRARARVRAATGDGAADGSVDYREIWERFQNASEAEIPSDENELMDVLTARCTLAKDEWGGTIKLASERVELPTTCPRSTSALPAQDRACEPTRASSSATARRRAAA